MTRFESTGMWPTSLTPRGELDETVDDVERKLGVEFERGRDERGTYVWLAGMVGPYPVAFDRYAVDPALRIHAEDAETARTVRTALGLTERA